MEIPANKQMANDVKSAVSRDTLGPLIFLIYHYYRVGVLLNYMSGCKKCCPFLGTLNIR